MSEFKERWTCPIFKVIQFSVVHGSVRQKFRQQYEKEEAHGKVSAETQFAYSWCLVRSPQRQDNQRGVKLLEGWDMICFYLSKTGKNVLYPNPEPRGLQYIRFPGRNLTLPSNPRHRGVKYILTQRPPAGRGISNWHWQPRALGRCCKKPSEEKKRFFAIFRNLVICYFFLFSSLYIYL